MPMPLIDCSLILGKLNLAAFDEIVTRPIGMANVVKMILKTDHNYEIPFQAWNEESKFLEDEQLLEFPAVIVNFVKLAKIVDFGITIDAFDGSYLFSDGPPYV